MNNCDKDISTMLMLLAFDWRYPKSISDNKFSEGIL